MKCLRFWSGLLRFPEREQERRNSANYGGPTSDEPLPAAIKWVYSWNKYSLWVSKLVPPGVDLCNVGAFGLAYFVSQSDSKKGVVIARITAVQRRTNRFR